MKIFLFMFFCSFLFVCCNNNKRIDSQVSDEKNSDYPICLFLENIEGAEGTELLSEEFSEINYIPLETNSNSLLTKLDKVLPWNGSYLVSDFRTLHLFDDTGRFVQKISQAGSGPADYRYINNIIADPSSGGFYLFTLNKVIKFDSEVNYVNNIPLKNISDHVPSIYSQGILTPQGTFLLYLANQVWLVNDTTTVYSLIEMDTLGRVLNYYKNQIPRYAESKKLGITNGKRPLYTYRESIRFLEFGHDTIYTIETDSMIPYAVLDLGNMKTNHNPELFRVTSVSEIENEMKKLDEKLTILNIMESDRYLYFILQYGFNGEFLYCIYNKKNKLLKKLKENGFSNDLDGGMDFYPIMMAENGDMITWKTAEEFKEDILSKDYDTQKAIYGERFEKVHQLAKSLKEDDNPVLVIAKKK